MRSVICRPCSVLMDFSSLIANHSAKTIYYS